MRRQLLALALALSTTALTAAPARAAPAKADKAKTDKPKTDGEAALAAFREGEALYALGHFREALETFEKAYKLKPVQGLLFNIAQCHRQLKQFELAVTTYRSFIRLAPDNPQVPKAKTLIEECEAVLTAQQGAVSALPLDSSGRDPGAKPIPIRVPPPKVDAPLAPVTPPPSTTPAAASPPAIATAPAPKEPPRALPASSGPAAPPESVRPPERRTASGTRTVTWITAGTAVVALGAGTAFGLMSKSTASSISSQQHSRAEVDALQSQLSSQGTKANLLLLSGAALAVGAGVFYLLGL
jgi:tetratricopeptide (TPR) repeat protein